MMLLDKFHILELMELIKFYFESHNSNWYVKSFFIHLKILNQKIIHYSTFPKNTKINQTNESNMTRGNYQEG